MQFQPGQSSRDMLNQLAFEKLSNTNGGDDDLAKVMLVDLSARSVESIQSSLSKNSLGSVEAVQQLVTMGLDVSDPIIQNLLTSSARLAETLNSIADVIPRILKS